MSIGFQVEWVKISSYRMKTVKLNEPSREGIRLSFTEQRGTAQEFLEELFNKKNIEEIDRLATSDLVYHALFEDLRGTKCKGMDFG